MSKNKKGSILAYSLLVLAIMFAIIGSISSVSVLEKKSARSSNDSAQAYQVADNGVQKTIKQINDAINGKISGVSGASYIKQVFASNGFSCEDTTGTAVVKNQIDSDKQYVINLYTGSATPSLVTDCDNVKISEITNIKSAGNYQSAVRAVSVKVGSNDPCGGSATVSDTYGNTYPIKAYGDQCWMVENMNSGSDSDAILSDAVFPTSNTKIEKKCPINVIGNCSTYGALYDWAEALQLDQSCNSSDCASQIQPTHQGICPSGWHVPSEAEWDVFNESIYDSYKYSCATASSYTTKALASNSGWKDSTVACATGNNQIDNNASGFNISPMLTTFVASIGTYSYLQTTDQTLAAVNSARTIAIWNTEAQPLVLDIIKKSPHYVRCVKD